MRRGFPGRMGDDCVESDGDSRLTYGLDPTVGQRPDIMVRMSLNSQRFQLSGGGISRRRLHGMRGSI